MSAMRLAILGAASLRCGPPIVGTLASYFGERPLEIRMYDADAERVDLFDRLARLCFMSSYSPHQLITTSDPEEALDGADAIVLALDANCARKYLRSTSSRGLADIGDLGMVEQAVAYLIGAVPQSTPILSLLGPEILVPRSTYRRLEWPEDPAAEETFQLPFQILRWINKEEPVTDLLINHEQTPFKAWLDDPRLAELVLGTPA